MTEKIISPKSTSQFSNLIYTPDLTLATVNDITYVQTISDLNTPVNYDEYGLLEDIIIIGKGHPVILTASDIFSCSVSLNTGEEVWLTYYISLYDDTASTLIDEFIIYPVYYKLIGVVITPWGFLPFIREINVLIDGHQYTWSISWLKHRTGTSTIGGISHIRILTVQEIKR